MANAESRLSDAIVIATAPAVAYAFTYAFELGYAYHFDMPSVLVHPDVQSVLIFGVSAYIAFTFLGFGIGTVLSVKHAVAAYRTAYYTAMPIAFVWVVWVVTKGLPLGWRIAVLVPVSIFALLLLYSRTFRAFFHKSLGKTWDERWEAVVKPDLKSSAERRKENVLYRIFNALDPEDRWAGKLVILVILLWPVWWLGQFSGAMTSEFLVSQSGPPRAVIRRYGDMFVTAPVDRLSGRLGKGFVLMRVPTDSATTWAVELLRPPRSK